MENKVYLVEYEFHLVGIFSTEAKAIECALKAHRTRPRPVTNPGFKYSVWVTEHHVDDNSLVRDVGMFKKQEDHSESPWISAMTDGALNPDWTPKPE